MIHTKEHLPHCIWNIGNPKTLLPQGTYYLLGSIRAILTKKEPDILFVIIFESSVKISVELRVIVCVALLQI